MTAPPTGRAGQRRFTDGVEGFASAIGPGVMLEGTVRGTTDLRIMGEFIGDMTIEGLVWVGSEGRVEGTIRATDVLIEGTVTGSVQATGKIELRSSARVEADLVAGLIAAAEGSFLEGSVIVPGGGTDDVVTFAEKRGDGRPDNDDTPG